ncbi:MAG: TerB family tellurite resistance protein [Rhodothermaceae bacterium]
MLKILKEIFLPDINKANNQFSDISKHQIATCALLLEVANADDEFTDAEKEKIIEIMQSSFNLTKEQVSELMILADQSLEDSISLYEFTDILNNNFDHSEKKEILKNIWRLIFADNHLHEYEEYFVRKISKTLNLYHQDFIETKLQVKEELGI